MQKPNHARRRLMLAALAAPSIGALSGCRASLPPLTATTTSPTATALLKQSAAAHGAAALSRVHDLNVSYAGQWHRLVTKLQPSLVDAGFRGGSQERMLLAENLVAQAHTGPKGHKHVVRRGAATGPGDVSVWFNDQPASDDDSRHAAALVVDGYGLFLLGPMLLDNYVSGGRSVIMELAGTSVVKDGDRRLMCDLLRVQMHPGIGLSGGDDLGLYIERETHLMRRIRFSLEGLESTRGALAEVDVADFVELHGIQWPTRFHERLLRPAPLEVHDWRLTGLDVNRGYDDTSVAGSMFTGAALKAAQVL